MSDGNGNGRSQIPHAEEGNGNGTNGNGTNGELTTMPPELRAEIERGLQFANVIGTVNMDQNKETIASLQALTNVLIHNGIIRAEDLAKSLEEARGRVAQHPMPAVRLADLGDKHAEGQTVEIDCANRIHLCQARCCTFKFYLTKQDLDEGAARWDYGNPYWIRQGQDGYCIHSDSQTRACAIHAKRPHVCRAYDCRNDKRVWIDFEKRIPAPMPESSGCSPVAMAEVHMRHWGSEVDENGSGRAAEKEGGEKVSP
jgi:Fe-S-cluster containining protein